MIASGSRRCRRIAHPRPRRLTPPASTTNLTPPMGATDWLRSRVHAWVDSRLDPAFRAKLRALPTRQNEYGYDPFGFNRDDAKVAALVARFFYRTYFRVEAHDVARVPTGRALLVSN